MAPKSRSEKRRNFPDNLYETGGYYSYKHPKTGEHFGLGRDRAYAFRQAIEANMSVGATQRSLVERIASPKVRTWGAWLDEYWKLLQARKGKRGKPLAPNTLRTYRSLLKLCRERIDESKQIAEVDTSDVAGAIDAVVAAGNARMAQSLRSFLKDCFRCSIAKGWRTDNPALVTDLVKVEVKRGRLSFDVFMRLYEAERTVWARNTYALALVSAQDRESCSDAQFRDIKGGAWWNERGKTGARIVLPLELRLDCFGMSLDDVVAQCRKTGVLSHYLIHQTRNYGNSPAGSQIWIDTISRHFTATLATLQIDWGDKQPPTFHEIRSLSERLYKQQGNVDTQQLLAHKNPRTTAIYDDPRGEWVRVNVSR